MISISGKGKIICLSTRSWLRSLTLFRLWFTPERNYEADFCHLAGSLGNEVARLVTRLRIARHGSVNAVHAGDRTARAHPCLSHDGRCPAKVRSEATHSPAFGCRRARTSPSPFDTSGVKRVQRDGPLRWIAWRFASWRTPGDGRQFAHQRPDIASETTFVWGGQARRCRRKRIVRDAQ